MKKFLSLLSILTIAAPSSESLFSVQSCLAKVEWLSPEDSGIDVSVIPIWKMYTALSNLKQLTESDSQGQHDNSDELEDKVNNSNSKGDYSFHLSFDPSVGSSTQAASSFTNFVKKYETSDQFKIDNYYSTSTSNDDKYSQAQAFWHRIDPVYYGDAHIYDDDDGNVDVSTIQDVFQLWIQTRIELMRQNYAVLANKSVDELSQDEFVDYFTEYQDSSTDGTINGFIQSSTDLKEEDNLYHWNHVCFTDYIARVVQNVMDQWSFVSFDTANNIGTIYWAKTEVTSDMTDVSVEVQQTQFSYDYVDFN